MTPKELAAMQQALEALIEAKVVAERYQNAEKREQAITALREALAEQAEQEPVAWGQPDACGNIVDSITPYDKETPDMQKWAAQYSVPLYAAPVHTKDLTDEEIRELFANEKQVYAEEGISFARAVIAADREKNK